MAATILILIFSWLFIGLVVMGRYDAKFYMENRTPMEDFRFIVLWPSHLISR